MQYREYGTEHHETVILLHGGGLSWWNYREAAKLLQNEYHVILPILDGHAGSDRPFTSIEDNAAEIIEFIDSHTEPVLIGGLSLGGQVALEILSQRKDICRSAVIESAAVIPSRLTSALIGPAFGSSYGLIKSRRFARMQFQSLRIKEELFEDYYRDTCAIAKEDMIAFMKASTSYSLKDSIRGTSAAVRIFAGEKETGEILRSAKQIQSTVMGSTLEILPGLYHGEFSINHAGEYVRKLKQIMAE